MSKTKPKVIILGAGMAGLGAAIKLKKIGYDTTVLEKEAIPGGLFSNNSIQGCDFDFGPKILLLDDPRNREEILAFLGDNYVKYPVEERVYLSRLGLLNFPLQRHLIEIPKEERSQIISEIKRTRKNAATITSYEDWLIANYGEHLSRSVLIPYEEKKWQMSLADMDYRWALKRPVKVNLDEVIEGSKKHLPANRWYYYPKSGNIFSLTQEMAKQAGNIIFNSPVTNVDSVKKMVTAGGKKYSYDYLISTLPVDYLVSITNGVPLNLVKTTKRQLKRLSIRVFNLVYAGNHKLEGTAIYFPEKEFIFRRISILENLCPALKRDGKTPISVEVSINTNDKRTSEQIYKQALSDMQKIPQFAKLGDPIDHQSLSIDFAYPLQTRGFSYHIADLHRFFSSLNIFNCGRGGTYNYCNGDEAYRQGADVAQRVHDIVVNRPPSISVAIIATEPVNKVLETVESLWHSIDIVKFPVIVSCYESDITPGLINQLKPFGVKIATSTDGSGPAVLMKKAMAATGTDLLLTTKPGVIFDPLSINKLLREFTDDPHLTLASPRILSQNPVSNLQKTLQVGARMVDQMSNSWQAGDNYLSVQDKCMCFRTNMLSQIEMSDELVNCDAYFYFENRRLGGKFKSISLAKVYAPLDTDWNRYLSRVNNFTKSEAELEEYFKLDLKGDYKIPLSISAGTFINQVKNNPIPSIKYLFVLGASRFGKPANK
jgi:protoporphyrinogen oxidase